MVMVKARIQTRGEESPVVPIMVPDLREVRELAFRLHAEGKPWQGEAFGWSAEYNPQQDIAPIVSKMTYSPADFTIGESGIWFYSLMWERGKDLEPVEFLDDRNIVR